MIVDYTGFDAEIIPQNSLDGVLAYLKFKHWSDEMNISLLRDTLSGLGKEAICWAPMAIGLATNNPTIHMVSDIGYAAFHLYAAYKCKNDLGKLTSVISAIVSLASPCTYHPDLVSQLSTATKAHILLAMGGNNIARGLVEVASATKISVNDIFFNGDEDETSEENESTIGKDIGNIIRLGLGSFRVYAGSNQINLGMSQLQSKADLQEFLQMDSMDTNEETMDLMPSRSSCGETPPKVDKKYVKDEFVFPLKGQCKPKQPHPFDLAFYQKANSYPIKHEQRCEGTLYLRSEDTNCLHFRNGKINTIDPCPQGELNQEVARSLVKEGRVWYRPMEQVKDICKEIDKIHEQGGKIKRLILVGNGTSHEMTLSQREGDKDAFEFEDIFSWLPKNNEKPLFKFFGENENLNAKVDLQPTIRGMHKTYLDKNAVFPKKGCLNHLEPDADIILISSGTGKSSSKDNLADAIAKQARGHKVFAPKTVVNMSDIVVNVANKLKFSFKNPFQKDVTYTALIKKT